MTAQSCRGPGVADGSGWVAPSPDIFFVRSLKKMSGFKRPIRRHRPSTAMIFCWRPAGPRRIDRGSNVLIIGASCRPF